MPHAIVEQNFIVHDEWEDFLIGDAVNVADVEELLVGIEKPLEEAAEHTKGRVRDDNVGLAAQGFDFR